MEVSRTNAMHFESDFRMNKLLCELSDVILLCFSVVCRYTFEEAKNEYGLGLLKDISTPVILVGNKIDVRQDVSRADDTWDKNTRDPITKEESQQLAKTLGAVNYMECSAVTQEGLRDVFQEALDQALQYSKEKKKDFSFCKCM